MTFVERGKWMTHWSFGWWRLRREESVYCFLVIFHFSFSVSLSLSSSSPLPLSLLSDRRRKWSILYLYGWYASSVPLLQGREKSLLYVQTTRGTNKSRSFWTRNPQEDALDTTTDNFTALYISPLPSPGKAPHQIPVIGNLTHSHHSHYSLNEALLDRNPEMPSLSLFLPDTFSLFSMCFCFWFLLKNGSVFSWLWSVSFFLRSTQENFRSSPEMRYSISIVWISLWVL